MEIFFGDFYSKQELADLAGILQKPPLITTLRVNTLKCSRQEAKILLQTHFSSLGEPFLVQENEDFSDVLQIEAIGPNDFVPSSKEIIVDCSCGASILRGADLYAPGIIGMDDSIKLNDLVSIWADIDGNCSKGLKKQYNGKKVFIGNGICLYDRDQIFGEIKLRNVAVKMKEMKFKMPSLNGILTEYLFLQNIPSIMVAHALNPSPNSKVLDVCAAPGGKTCHIAAIMKNTGKIFALDRVSKKVEVINSNCRKLGVENVEAVAFDSSKIIQEKLFEPAYFDYILLDPPCSGLGLRPNLKFDNTDWKSLDSYAAFQRKLFLEAWSLLKPGGEMTYSTCTINPHENELLIDKMLNNLPDAELMPIRRGKFEKYCEPGLVIGSLTEQVCKQSFCRFIPSEKKDSNGFFLVKLRKRKN